MPARLVPFRALRYAPGTDLDAVIAPPYDVLSEADVAGLRNRHPHNVVHLDVPAGGESGSLTDRYAAAGRLLADWRDDGVLVRDADPSLTIYRMSFTDSTGAARELVGVLGGLEVVDEGAGGVLPHERTTPKASTDRLDLTRATQANLSPVWGLSLARGLTELLRGPAEEVGALTVDGVEHRVERLTDPDRIAAICDLVGSDDVLIADGHHRYGVARRIRDEIRSATGRSDTPAEHTLAFVGELVPEQLAVAAIHRLVAGLPHEDVCRVLARDFELTEVPADLAPGGDPAGLLAAMDELGRLVLVAPDGSAHWLTPRPGAFDGIRSLDGAWLEHTLAGSDVTISYQHGVAEVLRALADPTGQAGDAAYTAGILIRPTSLAEIERTAREGLLMPPKSTFFTPKLRTGLVIREL
ncbi:MAG TPA: DUF1015 domain-containing protein [Dermatophilaceae bacterium]|nr:DUF1015 domain-containing protein [Dermatophilaceae bacterium]